MTVALDLGNLSAISDYSDLVSKIKLWLDRGSDLDPFIPTFITLAEGYLNRVLRVPDMETTIAPTTISGAFTLPDDVIAIRGVWVAGRPLQASSPEEMATLYGAREGYATIYSIVGRQVSIAPIDTGAVKVIYWQRIPALTINNPTNWLLNYHSDIYLYGALVQAEAYIDNPERVAQWQVAFDGCVDQLINLGNRQKYGGPIVARAGPARIAGIRA